MARAQPERDVLAELRGIVNGMGSINDMWLDAPEDRQERNLLAEEPFRITAP